jgi:SAM-dependent methyltransferase
MAKNNLCRVFDNEFGNLLKKDVADKKYLNQNKIRYLETAKLIENMLKPFKTNPKVLDIGTSGFTFLVKNLFKLDVATIDITNKFEDKCKKEEICFRRCDLTKDKIPFSDNSFELVLLLEVIEHLKMDHRLLLKEISRVLKESGILIITTPNFCSLTNILLMLKGENVQPPLNILFEDNQSGDVHVREFTLKELSNLINGSSFDIVFCEHASYYDNIHTFKASDRYKSYFLPFFSFFAVITRIMPRFSRGINVVCTNKKLQISK